MQKTTLEQWRMFKAVVEHGGFNQAALAIHKSQSSVHHAVHKLEELLSVSLFEVKGRKTQLTQAGELLLKRGEFLLQEVERIESVAHSLSSGVESELRIAVDSAFPAQLVYSVLENVSASFPQLRIDIIESVLSGSNELMDEGIADIALSSVPTPAGLNEEICQINFIAVASPQHHLLQHHQTVTLEQLKACRQIVVRDSAKHKSKDEGWLGAEQRWTVSNISASLDLVKKGLGFAWLPETVISELLANGELVPLPLQQGARRSVTFYLNFRDQDSLGPAAREFIGELRLQTL
jgi:DNA-binding transcriptional LysR family regulator